MVLHKVEVPCQTGLLDMNTVSIFPDSDDAFDFARTIASIKSMRGENASFFVMDVDRVSLLLDEWFNCLPRVQPYYAVNCNSDPVLLHLLAKHSAVGFHCINRKNLDAIAGISNRVVYSNPCWTRGSLRHAHQSGIQTLAFDSSQALDRILGVCPDAELILNVCLDPTVEDSNAALGCTLDEAPELLQLAATLGANCVGIGFNVGSGCRQASLYAAAIQVSANLFGIGRTFGLEMKILSIGGGFANSYFQNQDQFATFSDICHTINESLDYFFSENKFSNLKVIAKPGRFFAGPSFSLITNIIGKNFDTRNDSFTYRINEGYYGSFGCVRVANCDPQSTPLFPSDADNRSAEHYFGSIYGPTTDEFDVVQSLCRFRQLEQGDWLLWANMGAYSMYDRGSLDDDSRNDEAPVVFYFATLSEWQKLNSNVVADVPENKIFLMESMSATRDLDRDGAFSPSLMSVVSSEDDMRSVTSEESSLPEEESDELWRLMLYFYECVGK